MWTTDLKVLVADDNKDAAVTLALLFEFEGCTVRIANTGVAALETFRAFNPKVCCLDIGMPGLSGYEVAKSIRLIESSGTRSLLIAISGWGAAKYKARARGCGFDHYLVKPPDFTALSSQIDAFLSRQSESE